MSKRTNTLKAQSFLIDGEIIGDDGTHDFRALRSRGRKAMLVAFNLLELDGDDLRSLPLIARKRRLARLIGRAKRPAIQYGEHLTGDGPTVFAHVSKLGLEGIVSKRADAPYRSGPSRTWLKSKNPASEAVRRGARGGVAVGGRPSWLSSVIALSRSQQGDGEHSQHAENDGGYPGHFDFGKPSPV